MGTSNHKRKLIEYFKKNLKKGYTPESLKWALINQHYSRMIVEEALLEANRELATKAPVLKEKPVIKYEVYDEHNRPISLKKPFWKRFFKK